MLKSMINPVLSGKTRIILFFIITFCCSYLSATIINIPADQPTIQAGIDIAVYGDTVLVQPGTYVENINYNGKNITVGSLFLSTQDTSYIFQTVIDGDSSGCVVMFESGEDTTAVLIGFTITNGSAYYGGGIFCYESSPSMENVDITGNIANYGGGIYCQWSSPSLVNVSITGNRASFGDGGGIYCCYYSSPSLENVTMVNVTIKGNRAQFDGGGIYCRWTSPSLVNVTITENIANDGGGIFCNSSSLSLANVTITGNSASSLGGGIYCNDSDLILKNVDIIWNIASDRGGGISCGNSSLNLVNVTIIGNSADYGGGIYCYDSSPSLENVTIAENIANDGGGIYCYDNSSPSLENVNIIGNSAIGDYSHGGGIYCSHSSSSLENVTIIGNSAVFGGGIYCRWSSNPILENVTITGNSAENGGGIYCSDNSSPSLENCILWNDYPQEIYFDEDSYPDTITISYSDVQGGESGIITNNNGTVNWLEGNIDANPLFLDPANRDYHLTENSPCIDAGDPDSPLDPDGTLADMGAYYYDQGEIILIWPGDTDYNGIVNEEDILPIGVYWRDTGSSRSSISFEWVGNDYPGGWDEPIASLADCNGDGEVNITDVLAICLNWNKTHSTVLESPFIPNNLEQYRDNFVEIYNSLGNSEIEIKIRNHIAEKFNLPTIEIMKVNKLYQNYPNPFSTRGGSRYISGNPETTISFSLTTANAENAKIEIYNIKGQKVMNLECDESLVTKAPMYRDYSITWDGRDENNKPVSSGIYFYMLLNNNKVIDYKKMLIIR